MNVPFLALSLPFYLSICETQILKSSKSRLSYVLYYLHKCNSDNLEIIVIEKDFFFFGKLCYFYYF